MDETYVNRVLQFLQQNRIRHDRGLFLLAGTCQEEGKLSCPYTPPHRPVLQRLGQMLRLNFSSTPARSAMVRASLSTR